MDERTGLKVAGGLLVFTGLGWGIPGVLGIQHFQSTGQILYFMGFPTYGDGPFEAMGIATTVPLLVAFLVVCLLEVVAGVRTWGAHRDGAILALLLLPVEFVFWYGFALPFPPMIAVVRTILIVRGWRSLQAV